MTFFDLRDRDGMEIQMQKRIVELEKANQDLRAEILEFKRAEGMLASNSQQLSEVLESISDGFCILDHNWRLTYVNSQAASYLKLISEDLIGRQLWEIYPQLVGTDLEVNFRKAMQERQQQAFEMHAVFKDLWHQFRVFPSKEGILVYFQDITEHKKAEEALSRERSLLASVLQTTDVMLAFLDLQFNFVWVNPAYAETCMMKPEDMVGKNHFILYPHEENEAIFRKVRDTGEGVFYKDKPFFFPDQPERGITYWDSSLTPVKDSCGNVTGLVISLRETTKYKRAEEAQRKSEERYRMLFTNMAEGFVLMEIIYDKDGKPYDYRYLEVNPTYEFNLDLKKEEILGKTLLEVFPNTSSTTIEKFGEVALSGQSTNFETFSQMVNKYVEGYVFSPEKGKVAAIFRDVTPRKEAEAKLKETFDNLENLVKVRTDELEKAYISLKESEERLADAQTIAHIGSFDWNITTNEEYWSDELYVIFGLDPKYDINHNTFLNSIHPEDLDYISHAINEALNGKPYNIDYRIILPDGKERVIYSQGGVIFDENSTPVRMRGIVQDITERKKTEEKIQMLANLVESSDDAIITESLDCIITSWNRGAEQVYGYSAEEILGKPISILAPPHLEEETRELVERVKQGKKIQQYETLRLRKDGKIINVSITLSPIFDIYGKFTAVSLIYRDITKRKEAEEALERIEITRQKEIHHRIKNNLQVISSLLDLQAGKFKDRGCINDSEVLEAFRESHDRVLSIALIHEELHEGEGEETLNFSLYLKKLIENLIHTYSLGNTAVSLNIDLEESIFFDMDIAVPLGMIVNELVSDSLKYAFLGRNEGEIKIKLFKNELSNDKEELAGKTTTYTLIVSDNGVGIPEIIDFENSDTLGLQLVNILVDQLDGEIELKRDNGTEFSIRFSVEK